MDGEVGGMNGARGALSFSTLKQLTASLDNTSRS